MQCGFEVTSTLRFGAMFVYCEPYVAVRCCEMADGALRSSLVNENRFIFVRFGKFM